jgi:CRISPR-associated protein Cmr3
VQFSLNECVREDDLFMREQRFGNAIDAATRTVRADEGMLYSGSFIRPCDDTGLLVQIPDTAPWEAIFPQVGSVTHSKLGGEGRAARIERIEYAVGAQVNDAHVASKLILITPAYFVQGVPTFTGITARALGRASPLGGWDLAKRRPRPIRRYAPLGSVFIVNGGADLPALLTEQPTGELPLTELGFGEYLRLSIED